MIITININKIIRLTKIILFAVLSYIMAYLFILMIVNNANKTNSISTIFAEDSSAIVTKTKIIQQW